jgi:hypothetical protein
MSSICGVARPYACGVSMRRRHAERRLAGLSLASVNTRGRFLDQFRAYVINANLGKDLVRKYIESRGSTPDQPGTRWQEFANLLSAPRLPSGLP